MILLRLKQHLTALFLFIVSFACTSCLAQTNACKINIHNFFLRDSSRNRLVPVAIYEKEQTDTLIKPSVAIINHGYGGTNTAYSFIANHLATQGYVVICIQHDLPGDAPIAMTGDLFKLRKPVWEEGVKNILFTLEILKKFGNTWNFDKLLVIGHSNGGDMTMLMAVEHPEMIWKAVSLDNRRMPIPRISHPQILSFRSSDMQADPGVLPTEEEQGKFGIQIINLKNTKHIDMCDEGRNEQKEDIIKSIAEFLKESKTH